MSPDEALLYAKQDQPLERKPRVDLKLELMIIRCAIGLLSAGRDMSKQDYTRLHLAVARLRVSQ